MLKFWTDLPAHPRKITIPTHLLALGALGSLYFIEFSWLWYTLLGWIVFAGLGMAVGYHRYFSHKAFKASRWAEYLMAYTGIFGGQGPAIFWVALHRGYHHPHSDTLKDLHSPIHGRWSAYMGWIFKESAAAVSLRYAVDLARDPMHVFIHRNYYKLFWGVTIVTAIFSWQLALFFLILPSVIAQHQENLVDLFCHEDSWGSYRNHETRDRSVNVHLLGYLGWGQGWHNNHHARPADADFGSDRWFEFDPTRLLIPLVSK